MTYILILLQNSGEINPSLLEQYKEAFTLFDDNDSGYITASELGEVMGHLGFHPTDTELQDIINEVDVDGNSTIDFNEFVKMMTRTLRDTEIEEQIKEVSMATIPVNLNQ